MKSDATKETPPPRLKFSPWQRIPLLQCVTYIVTIKNVMVIIILPIG